MSERPRTPAFTYAALTLAILLLLGLFALTNRQPPPPSIAEFAPQAVEQITDSPDDLSSRRNAGAGGQTPVPSVPPDDLAGINAIDVPRVRRCVGDPPRQTEDPQSPPCVPYWSGDNGGATARGVTRDSVRVIVNDTGSTNADEGTKKRLLFERYFNSRFEFYGRKLAFAGWGVGKDCATQTSTAAAAVQTIQPFATQHIGGTAVTCYYKEMARQGVILSDANTMTFAEPDMQAARPYMWQYSMGMDDTFASLGRWACKRMSGRNAEYSPNPLISSAKRKFGMVFMYNTFPPPYRQSFEPIRREMRACGETINVYTLERGASEELTQDAMQVILQMKQDGITSSFCLCVSLAEEVVSSAADAQAYYPEWVMSTYLNNDSSFIVKASWPQASQRRALMAVQFTPIQIGYNDHVAIRALREMDPAYRSPQSNDLRAAQIMYRSLLLIASGIQMAGPRLTPAAFEAALHRTRFPNPITPLQAGRVGFEHGTHAMVKDGVEMWWGESAPAPYADEGTGAWCYSNRGKRYAIDEWPGERPNFFNEPCFTGATP